MRNLKCVAVLVSALIMVGCASNRSEVSISTPKNNKEATATSTAAAPVGKKQVYLRSIKDSRVFEEAPKDPSIPSLGFGGAASALPDVKARAIGRKRNGYGKAMGDVMLPEGQSVVWLVNQQLRTVLEEAGYHVITQPSTQADALVVDVDVKELWSWIQMGFWSFSMHNKIATEITLENKDQPITIKSVVQQSRSLATDSAWKEIAELGMKDYRSQLQKHWVSTLEK